MMLKHLLIKLRETNLMAETPSGSLPLIDRWETGLAFHGNSVELKAYDYEQTKLVSSKAQRNKNTIANNTNLTNTFYPTLGIQETKQILRIILPKDVLNI